MFKLALFLLCIAFLTAAGGATAPGMALGALGFALGAVEMIRIVWRILTR